MTEELALEALARTCRVAARLGHIDLLGHVSARLAGDLVLTTPSFADGRVLPLSCRAEDLITVDLSGGRVRGEGDLPYDLDLDLAIYRRREDVGALVVGAPEHALSLGIADLRVLPLTHSESRMVHAGVAHVRPTALAATPEVAEPLAAALGRGVILQIEGVSVVVTGTTLIEALERMDRYEYLAELTVATLRVNPAPRLVSAEESAAVGAERPAEKVATRDPRLHYDGLDPAISAQEHTKVTVAPESSPSDSKAVLSHKVALACRILADQGSLVLFKEHVSHRMQEADRYLLSPAKTFADMEAADIGEVGMEGDCAWLSGPYPPVPFRWYHRDLFQARPDVHAVVHTHELHGRALPMAGIEPMAVFRNGAQGATAGLPVFGIPTLIFREDYRKEVIARLGSNRSVHTLSHGTDYVGRSVEEALTSAIHREQSSRMHVTAASVGTPREMDPAVVAELSRVMPSPSAWWAFYTEALHS
ncbi:MAG: class aldolase/adducin family protein [Actinotalea sp.]|nr:class aldolase/adducin family protein [Actinotalea sp.]